METKTLKALALKVLQGNSEGNFLEIGSFQDKKLKEMKSADVSMPGNRAGNIPYFAVKGCKEL